MLWQAQHGATAEEYRNQCLSRGAPVPAYLTPPTALPGVLSWYLAFWELSTDRRFQGGPIPWSSLVSYPVRPDEADLFRAAIREADRAYLGFLAKPIEDRQSLPVASSGFFKGKPKDG